VGAPCFSRGKLDFSPTEQHSILRRASALGFLDARRKQRHRDEINSAIQSHGSTGRSPTIPLRANVVAPRTVGVPPSINAKPHSPLSHFTIPKATMHSNTAANE
jgi:hypothetical protein